MDDVDETAFEQWFSGLETVPNGGREITAAFDSLSDIAILDLLRETAGFPLLSLSWQQILSGHGDS